MLPQYTEERPAFRARITRNTRTSAFLDLVFEVFEVTDNDQEEQYQFTVDTSFAIDLNTDGLIDTQYSPPTLAMYEVRKADNEYEHSIRYYSKQAEKVLDYAESFIKEIAQALDNKQSLENMYLFFQE